MWASVGKTFEILQLLSSISEQALITSYFILGRAGILLALSLLHLSLSDSCQQTLQVEVRVRSRYYGRKRLERRRESFTRGIGMTGSLGLKLLLNA